MLLYHGGPNVAMPNQIMVHSWVFRFDFPGGREEERLMKLTILFLQDMWGQGPLGCPILGLISIQALG
jgi:hypothetical protein